VLDHLLDRQPCFGYRRRGYDRAQVDGYVAWAESELEAARRQCDYLLERYGAAAGELDVARRRPAPSMIGPVSERLGEMLRLASEEAEAIAAAGVEEAQRIVTEARQEGEARLAKVAEILEAAAVRARTIHDGARDEADLLLRRAAAERAAAHAEAAGRLSAVQAEVDDLRQQRDEARESLHRLTAQIGLALQGVGPA
jgi:cell division septum initiation protein DivIVA